MNSNEDRVNQKQGSCHAYSRLSYTIDEAYSILFPRTYPKKRKNLPAPRAAIFASVSKLISSLCSWTDSNLDSVRVNFSMSLSFKPSSTVSSSWSWSSLVFWGLWWWPLYWLVLRWLGLYLDVSYASLVVLLSAASWIGLSCLIISSLQEKNGNLASLLQWLWPFLTPVRLIHIASTTCNLQVVIA